jgi:hypothetical protein
VTDTYLHYYTCHAPCRWTATFAHKTTDRHVRCQCGRFMVFSFSRPIETEEQRKLAARGIVLHSPHARQPWDCRRCGDAQGAESPQYFPAGGFTPCCGNCKDALGLNAQLATLAEKIARLTPAEEAELAALVVVAKRIQQRINERQPVAAGE